MKEESQKCAKMAEGEAKMAETVEEKQMNVDNSVVTTYKLVPPEGGWGYAVVAAMTIMFISTATPMGSFGIFFSGFLKSVGDETTGTTLTNAMFNTISSFTGLATNFLLKKLSYRKVGLLGALLLSAGAFGVIIAESMVQFIFFFGFVQGLGFGLLFPASCTAFNCYFDKKLNLMMSISQAVMAASNMAFPVVAALMMSNLGYKVSVAAIAVFSLVNLPAMASLQPIKWHLKKVPVPINDTVILINEKEDEKAHREPLMPKKSLNNEFGDKMIANKLLENVIVYQYERRTSIVSLGERAVSVTAEDFDYEKNLRKDDKRSIWQSFHDQMDLSLLKDWHYVNIAIGLSLSYMADVAFISLIPLLLSNSGFDREEVAFTMTIYFGMDLIGRVSLTFISTFCKGVKNKTLFLIGTSLSACFRVAFVANNSYIWKVATLGCLGFLRSHIQTPFSLVISENYPKNFATAFSLLMVIVGCVSLVIGPLLSIIKHLTGSDIIASNLLTLAFFICTIAWLIEPVFSPKKKPDDGKK